MNKWIYVIIGLFFISLGVLGVVTGETIGFSIGNDSGIKISAEDSFIEYCISLALIFYIGIAPIKYALLGEPDKNKEK